MQALDLKSMQEFILRMQRIFTDKNNFPLTARNFQASIFMAANLHPYMIMLGHLHNNSIPMKCTVALMLPNLIDGI